VARHLTLSLALLAGTVACSEQIPELRRADVEAAVGDASSDLELVDIGCPDVDELGPIPEGDFVPIVCTGLLGGDEVILDAVLIRAGAESVEVTVAVSTPILDVSTVEVDAAARLDADLGGSPMVRCAQSWVVVRVGREISCRVTAEGGTAGPVDQPAVVRILDVDGGWELDLTP
jgi:hypothetical protein